MRKLALSLAALAALLMTAMTTPAQAELVPGDDWIDPVISNVSDVIMSGTTAYVDVTFTCYGGGEALGVVVAVFQGPKLPSANIYTEDSKAIKARYDGAIQFPSGIMCDGVEQTVTVTLTSSKGRLHPGTAIVDAWVFDAFSEGPGPGATQANVIRQVSSA